MKFRDFFSNDFETNDHNNNQQMITHYYRSDKDKIIDEIKRVMGRNGFELLEENKQYNELRYYKVNFEVIITVYSENYYKQGVDFKVNTNYLISRGRGLKFIIKTYEELDKLFEKAK